jgi:hypothetical protein
MENNNQTKDQVIDNFIRSDEFVDKYGYTPGINEAPEVTYGGGDASTNYITDQDAYETTQTERADQVTHSTTASADTDDYLNAYANLTATADNTAADTIAATEAVTDSTTAAAIANQQTNTVDEWLTDFYEEHGINDGKVDQGGRDYWTESLANKSVEEVENDILYAAANNPINNSSIVDQPASTDTTATGGSDWLQDAYTAAGLGTVDAGGRKYWEKDLGKGQTQGQIIANILRQS